MGDTLYLGLVRIDPTLGQKSPSENVHFPWSDIYTATGTSWWFLRCQFHINDRPFICDVLFPMSCCRKCSEERAVKRQDNILL